MVCHKDFLQKWIYSLPKLFIKFIRAVLMLWKLTVKIATEVVSTRDCNAGLVPVLRNSFYTHMEHYLLPRMSLALVNAAKQVSSGLPCL